LIRINGLTFFVLESGGCVALELALLATVNEVWLDRFSATFVKKIGRA